MLTEVDLKELLEYRSTAKVVSVYLNTEPTEGNADAQRLRLRSMLKEIDLPQDEAAILQYFDHDYDWSGRSVAVFSCAADQYLRAYALAVPVRSRLRVNDRPHVKPLADLLDAYGGYGVALVDKQGARVFYFHLGELREQEGLMGEAIRHTKKGGASSVAGQRGGVAGTTGYVDEMTDRNMKDAAEFATHFFADNNVRRVLIGGTDENVALFRGRLPKAWQSLVVGSFAVSMTASHTEVMERAMEIGRAAEIRRDAHLADAVVTAAAKGKAGALGLADTLTALNEGRIQTLLIRDGYRAPGFRCNDCRHMTAQHFETCPFCGGASYQIPDAVELAVSTVMQNGGDVEVLQVDQNTPGFNGIGALLRY